MAAKSSFLPRLSLSSDDGPLLPLFNAKRPSMRKKPSEYDLSEVSPRRDHALLSSEPMDGRNMAPFDRRSPSPTARYSDEASNTGSASRSKPNQRVLFAGPPPPIAVSRVLYRDEEDRGAPSTSPRGLNASSLARSINSVLFDRGSSPSLPRNRDYDHRPDAVWLNLQRRERALQRDLQRLLDAQSAGLAAHLGPEPPGSSSSAARSDASDTNTTPTDATPPHSSRRRRSQPLQQQRHVTFEFEQQQQLAHGETGGAGGVVMPVRQPRPPKPLGLRAARAGLARTMALLADLKAEEDATLAAAAVARRRALARLRALTARREGIASELRALEADDERDQGEDWGDQGAQGDDRDRQKREQQQQQRPLGRELRELREERERVGGEIADLEARLAALKQRRKFLDGRIEEVRNAREAGLSGYRGALKEVEGKIAALLRTPGVTPLDVNSFRGADGNGDSEDGGERVGQGSPGGVEFLRLRPERRTAEMAREWWEAEMEILERRKTEVDKEKTALEEGSEVWNDAVKLVSEFEAGLRRELAGAEGGKMLESREGKGKGKEKASDSGASSPPPSPVPPEQAMYTQLDKMAAVMAGLEERLNLAEEKGWNLLICAIGAELEAFRQAEGMLREALRAAGYDVGDDANDDSDKGGSTPRLGRSASMRDSGPLLDGPTVNPCADMGPGTGGKQNLVDLGGQDEEKAAESDNEVPADLLVAAAEEHGLASPALSRQDSENEVPIEFLMEHRLDADYPSFRH